MVNIIHNKLKRFFIASLVALTFFIPVSSYAVISTVTNHTNEPIAIDWSAEGCADSEFYHLLSCHSMTLNPGQTASYDFDWGTTSLHVSVGSYFKQSAFPNVHNWAPGMPENAWLVAGSGIFTSGDRHNCGHYIQSNVDSFNIYSIKQSAVLDGDEAVLDFSCTMTPSWPSANQSKILTYSPDSGTGTGQLTQDAAGDTVSYTCALTDKDGHNLPDTDGNCMVTDNYWPNIFKFSINNGVQQKAYVVISATAPGNFVSKSPVLDIPNTPPNPVWPGINKTIELTGWKPGSTGVTVSFVADATDVNGQPLAYTYAVVKAIPLGDSGTAYTCTDPQNKGELIYDGGNISTESQSSDHTVITNIRYTPSSIKQCLKIYAKGGFGNTMATSSMNFSFWRVAPKAYDPTDGDFLATYIADDLYVPFPSEDVTCTVYASESDVIKNNPKAGSDCWFDPETPDLVATKVNLGDVVEIYNPGTINMYQLLNVGDTSK